MGEVEAADEGAAGVAALTSEGLQGSRPWPRRSTNKMCSVFERGWGGSDFIFWGTSEQARGRAETDHVLKNRHPAPSSPECLYRGFGCPRPSSATWYYYLIGLSLIFLPIYQQAHADRVNISFDESYNSMLSHHCKYY